MAIMPPYTEEDTTGASERLFLHDLVRFLDGTGAPREGYWNPFKHFATVLQRAARNEDYYEKDTREIFVRILGKEAAIRFIETILPFVQNYLLACRAAEEMIPLDFQPVEARAEIAAQVAKLARELQPCFPIWPPPRRGSCF
jgi:hypothetical protein